ncbi:MAG TPA: glycine zipper domain-containing protein [Pirellulales bacterium]|jgi:hypothetical protein
MTRALVVSLITMVFMSSSVGCHSPYYADQGALAGGLGGAGLGALIGSTSGHTGAGAAIGAAAGALTGGAVGGALDNIDAKNRAQIAAATGHPAAAVSVNDVIAMSRSGIDEQIIVNQLASAGLQRPLQSNDVIYLQQNGVTPHVISIMQQTRVAVNGPPPGAIVGPPPAVVVADPYYGPYYGYRPYYGPRVGVTYVSR